MEQSKSNQSVGVRLVSKGGEDLPVMANFARVQVSVPLMVIDFGFVEPAALNAVSNAARTGSKIPESMDGRLAARVALTPDALISLHQQLGQTIAGLQQQVGQALAGLKAVRNDKEAPAPAAMG